MIDLKHATREDIAAYRADPRPGSTTLSRFAAAGTPGKYRWETDHPPPISEAMIIGSAVDCLVFTPEWFDEKFTTPPLTPDDLPKYCVMTPSGQTKAAKAEREEIEYKGLVPVKEEDFDIGGLRMITKAGQEWKRREKRRVLTAIDSHNVFQCVDAINNHPKAADLLAAGQYQMPLYGDRAKTLPDILGPGVITDLKKTRDADPARVMWQIEELRMHWQAAMYMDVAAENCLDIREWRWIFAEALPPFRVEVSAPVPAVLIDLGRSQYRDALDRYLACVAANKWPISTYSELVYDLPTRAYR